MNLTLGQKVAMVMVVFSALAGGAGQLEPITGKQIALAISSLAGLGGTIVSGWLFIITGQSSLVKQVAEMPGVQKIDVNAQANSTLANLALDPKVDKVGPLPEAVRTVIKTAQGA